MEEKLNNQLKILLESINKIIEYNNTNNSTFEDFIKHEMVFDAIIMQLLHLWESTKNMKDSFPNLDFLPFEEMIWMRNFIAHNYLWISEKVIYNTVINDIPELKIRIETYFDKK